MKSSPESRATVPQRLMFKEGRKVGRKSVLCHWKGFASGRGEGENKGRRAGRGVKRELGPKRKREDSKSQHFKRKTKKNPQQSEAVTRQDRGKLQMVSEEMCQWQRRERESGGVDRGGERHFLWLQAQLVSLPDRRGCQIFIPALETAGGVNTAPASVMPPHKTQPCVCAHSGPTVTTRRYHVGTGSASSLRLLLKK